MPVAELSTRVPGVDSATWASTAARGKMYETCRSSTSGATTSRTAAPSVDRRPRSDHEVRPRARGVPRDDVAARVVGLDEVADRFHLEEPCVGSEAASSRHVPVRVLEPHAAFQPDEHRGVLVTATSPADRTSGPHHVPASAEWPGTPGRRGWAADRPLNPNRRPDSTARIRWLKYGFRDLEDELVGTVHRVAAGDRGAAGEAGRPGRVPPKVTVCPAIWAARSIGTFVICPKSKAIAGSTPYPAMAISWDMVPSAIRPVSWRPRSADDPWKLRFCACSMMTPPAIAMSDTVTPHQQFDQGEALLGMQRSRRPQSVLRVHLEAVGGRPGARCRPVASER